MARIRRIAHITIVCETVLLPAKDTEAWYARMVCAHLARDLRAAVAQNSGG